MILLQQNQNTAYAGITECIMLVVLEFSEGMVLGTCMRRRNRTEKGDQGEGGWRSLIPPWKSDLLQIHTQVSVTGAVNGIMVTGKSNGDHNGFHLRRGEAARGEVWRGEGASCSSDFCTGLGSSLHVRRSIFRAPEVLTCLHSCVSVIHTELRTILRLSEKMMFKCSPSWCKLFMSVKVCQLCYFRAPFWGRGCRIKS